MVAADGELAGGDSGAPTAARHGAFGEEVEDMAAERLAAVDLSREGRGGGARRRRGRPLVSREREGGGGLQMFFW